MLVKHHLIGFTTVTIQLTHFSSCDCCFITKIKICSFQNLPSFTCSDKASRSGLALGCVYSITVYLSVPCVYLNIVF